MPAVYKKTSPYYETSLFGQFLDVLTNRPIPKLSDDEVFVINSVYAYRPDLLAHDLYNDATYWWVFAARNPNVLEDPIFDFYPGQTIFIPKLQTLVTALGS